MRGAEWLDLAQYVDAGKFGIEPSGSTECGKFWLAEDLLASREDSAAWIQSASQLIS
jgi:hypothetical protein